MVKWGNSMKLAVIIINHQHTEMIQKAINSLPENVVNEPHQLFVINNLPDERTAAWLADHYPQAVVIHPTRPRGFASNINSVIRENPDFDFYLLLNPDVICHDGMVDRLLTAMREDGQVGAAGPELLNPDGTVQPSRRRFARFKVLVIRALHLDKVFKGLSAVADYMMHGEEFEPISEVDWVTGAVMLLRKTALDQVGLMDERFHLYFEDEDLCCRMWRAGWKVVYVKHAQADHVHIAAGRNKIFSKENFHHILSAVKMLIKYRGRISRFDREKNASMAV